MDVISPQMAEFFEGMDEDPVCFFQDRERMLMIYTTLESGGVQGFIERLRPVAAGKFLSPAFNSMQANGVGNAAALRDLLPQMGKNARHLLERLQSISPAEEQAVRNCRKEIEESVFRSCPGLRSKVKRSRSRS